MSVPTANTFSGPELVLHVERSSLAAMYWVSQSIATPSFFHDSPVALKPSSTTSTIAGLSSPPGSPPPVDSKSSTPNSAEIVDLRNIEPIAAENLAYAFSALNLAKRRPSEASVYWKSQFSTDTDKLERSIVVTPFSVVPATLLNVYVP